MKKPKIEVKKIEMHLKCILTGEELLQAGKDMADAQQEARTLESELDRIKKDFNSKITTAECHVSDNAAKIRSGYEFRKIPCEVHSDIPSKGKKTVYRLDNDSVVEVREMTGEEMQHQLALAQEGQD